MRAMYRHEEGMTLIEVMVSLVILLLIFLPASYLMTSGVKVQTESKSRLVAQTIVQQMVANIRQALPVFVPSAPYCNAVSSSPSDCNGFSLPTTPGPSSCGTIGDVFQVQPTTASLPTSVCNDGQLYKLTYSASYTASPNEPVLYSCLPSTSLTYPPVSVKVTVTATWMMSGVPQYQTVTSYLGVPSSYFSIFNGYLVLYVQGGTTGRLVQLSGSFVDANGNNKSYTYIPPLGTGGCAAFMDIPSNPVASSSVTYNLDVGGNNIAVQVCQGQTTPVELTSSGNWETWGYDGTESGPTDINGQPTLRQVCVS